MIAIAKRIDAYFKAHVLLITATTILGWGALLMESAFRRMEYPALGKLIGFPSVIFVIMLFAGVFVTLRLRPGVTVVTLISTTMLIYAGAWMCWLLEPFVPAPDLGGATVGTLAAVIAWRLSPGWHRWWDEQEKAVDRRRKHRDRQPQTETTTNGPADSGGMPR
jgi:hypothetical protein